MIPPLIVETALEKDIDLIAITDHNASANVAAVQKAAEGTKLIVLPGMEAQTREEVHVLILFDTLQQLASWQEIVDAHLPDIMNNADFFGDQFIVDETGDFIRREERLLLTSTTLSLTETWHAATELGGLVIPAHIDRQAFGLLPNLGFIPTDVPWEALEFSRHISLPEARKKYPDAGRFPLIQSGDVHYLDDFMGANLFTLQAATIAEIRLALRMAEGRLHRIDYRHIDNLRD